VPVGRLCALEVARDEKKAQKVIIVARFVD
jgi:hypothetical protein